jgi:iron complex transport system ATP-binding protein
LHLLAEHVSFSYDQNTRVKPGRAADAVSDVSLHVERGSFTGLLGPNGCGKTTLLKLLAGIVAPAQGRVLLGDRALSTIGRRTVARTIAVVPQETHPAFDYTSIEMVLMGRHPHLGTFQVEGPHDIELAYDALDATGTAHLAERNYMTLSGGEKQRVIIASALAQQPQILLLDEPTASLDLGYQLEIQTLLTRLNHERGVTMVLATHDLNLAAAVCNRLVMMRDGSVLAQGPTRDVLTPVHIRQLYGVHAEVRRHPTAEHLTVMPLGRA